MSGLKGKRSLPGGRPGKFGCDNRNGSFGDVINGGTVGKCSELLLAMYIDISSICNSLKLPNEGKVGADELGTDVLGLGNRRPLSFLLPDLPPPDSCPSRCFSSREPFKDSFD